MITRTTVLVGSVVIAGVLIGRAATSAPTPARQPLSSFNHFVGDWEGRPAAAVDARTLALLGADEYLNRLYVAPDGAAVALYIGYYQSQREGTSIHSPLNCLPGAGWEPTEKRQITIGGGATINRLLIRKGLDRQMVLYWYNSQGRVVASEYWAKAYTVLDALRRHRRDGALVRVIAPLRSADRADEEVAERTSLKFVEALMPLLPRYIPQ